MDKTQVVGGSVGGGERMMTFFQYAHLPAHLQVNAPETRNKRVE